MCGKLFFSWKISHSAVSQKLMVKFSVGIWKLWWGCQGGWILNKVSDFQRMCIFKKVYALKRTTFVSFCGISSTFFPICCCFGSPFEYDVVIGFKNEITIEVCNYKRIFLDDRNSQDQGIWTSLKLYWIAGFICDQIEFA